MLSNITVKAVPACGLHLTLRDKAQRPLPTTLCIGTSTDMSELNPRTYFIKSTRTSSQELVLDPVVVARNKLSGMETTIVLDTNILIRMEKAVSANAKSAQLKQFGLHNLVSLLSRCPPKSICLSPGMALDELPPQLAEQARAAYEHFCSRHLPTFVDTPNSINSAFTGKKFDYGFFDLEPRKQEFLAIPFISLLYISLVDRAFKAPPIEKFREYLRLMSEELDVLSMKEIEIAKYCFANPPATARATIEVRKKIRGNFVKTKDDRLPTTSAEAQAVAFNGACDLNLLNSANIIDKRGVDGVPQDCWIATRDKKLYEFCRVSHYVNVDGEPGKFIALSLLPDQEGDGYWNQALDEQRQLSQARTVYHESRRADLAGLGQKVLEAVKKLAATFPDA